MVQLRKARIDGIANFIAPAEVDDETGDAELVLVGWGSTYGAINAGVGRVRAAGKKVAHIHLTHIHPFPANLAELLGRYKKVLVPELNLGQLSQLLRAEFLVDAKSLNKVRGVPFQAAEIEAAILEQLGA